MLRPVEPFVRRDVANGPRRCAVLELSGVVDGIPPEVLGKAAVV
jgi:hypothetical protein